MAATSETWPQTARAWIYSSAGTGLEKSIQLEAESAPPSKSLLGRESVLVRVTYMSTNPVDYKVAEFGLLARALVSLPASPGLDYSGTVVTVGSNVTAYKPGQSVFGRIEPAKNGTLSEYIIVKDGEGLAPVPEGLEDKMDQLAGIGTCALTALQSIQPYFPGEGAAKGEKVFINGGSGGTGTFGIQVAKALGLHVTASCSGANAELCRSLGADEIIDYKKQNISEALKAQGKVFALVVDNVGYTPDGQQDLYTAANDFLVDGGHFIQVGGGTSASYMKSLLKRSITPAYFGGGKNNFKMIMTKQSHKDLARIGGWIKDGKVKVVIDEVFTFENAPAAYEKLKSGRAKGKIVINVTK